VVGKALSENSNSGIPGSHSSQVQASDEIGFKEGRNELGQVWKEDWQRNEKAQYERSNKWTQEDKNGVNCKFGEWKEIKKGEYIAQEKWSETYR